MSKFGSKPAQKLAKQGANPAAMYGVAVTGLNEDMLTQVRRTAACGTPPYASGRSLDITLQLANLDLGPDATGPPWSDGRRKSRKPHSTPPCFRFKVRLKLRLWPKLGQRAPTRLDQAHARSAPAGAEQ